MLPVVAAIIPIYIAARDVHMLDNVFTLVILYTAMNLPIAVWMMRSFFLEVPGELLEAAEMDGAPLRKTVVEVILPVVAPGLAATALICCIFAWNEFFFAVNLDGHAGRHRTGVPGWLHIFRGPVLRPAGRGGHGGDAARHPGRMGGAAPARPWSVVRCH